MRNLLRWSARSGVCTDAPGARVVITADHGFIYTRRELSECQMLGKLTFCP